MATTSKELALAVLHSGMFTCGIDEDVMPELLERLDRRMLAATVRTAMFSLLAADAAVVQRYRLRTPEGWQPEHRYRMSMTVRGGVPMLLERRSAGPAPDA